MDANQKYNLSFRAVLPVPFACIGVHSRLTRQFPEAVPRTGPALTLADAFAGFLGVPGLPDGFGLRVSFRHSEFGILICTIACFTETTRFMTVHLQNENCCRRHSSFDMERAER